MGCEQDITMLFIFTVLGAFVVGFVVGILNSKSDYDLLKEANGLLRSANAIANRRGESTNWEPFKEQVSAALRKQHRRLYKRDLEYIE